MLVTVPRCHELCKPYPVEWKKAPQHPILPPYTNPSIMDPDFARIIVAAILGTVIGLSLEVINPNRDPKSKVTPMLAGTAWGIAIAAAALIL